MSYTKPKLFERFEKIKEKHKNLEVGNVVRAGLKQSLTEFKIIIKE